MDVLAATENALGQAREQTDSPTPEAGIVDTNKAHENKFQQAISVWRGINLSNLVSRLDATTSDIVAHQRDSLVQRKDLAQKTKDFRKLDDTSKLAEYKGLLKSYQTFIDLLTNHGKTSSSAFLQLYSALSEAPDPYPLLEASIDSLVLSEDIVPKLTSERDFLQRNLNRVTTQLEESEKKLEDERTLRRRLEESQDAKIKEVEASWTAVLTEKTNNWEAKEKNYEERAENHERLLKELKASYEVSQRLGRDENDDGSRIAASAAEIEILSSDLEKTSQRLAEVEARNEQLRLELAQAVSHAQNESRYRNIEDDPAYLRLQSENSSLMRKLESARFDRDAEKHKWEGKLRLSERAVTKVTTEKEELRRKLNKCADYDDIRRELEVMKAIEFATGDDDDGDSNELGVPISANGPNPPKEISFEQLLLSKNKRLSNELTVLRVSHQDLQNQLTSLSDKLSRTNLDLEKARSLSKILENDLLQMQKETSDPPSSAMSISGTMTSRYLHSSRRGRISPTSSIISGFDPASASAHTMEAIRAGEPVGGGSGILPMVQAQRDRFRQKNAELEEELAKTYNAVKALRQEVASLQKDNLNLYEKTRFVSTYNRGGQTSTSSAYAYANRPTATSIHVAPDTPSGLSLDKYQSAYESQISPFAAFRGREAARAYKRMSFPERIIFSVTRMVLANRMSRNLFASYCVALHMLVFGMLYMMSTAEIEKHATIAMGTLSGAAAESAGGGGQFGSWQQEGLDRPA